jgi:hypothetical protein
LRREAFNYADDIADVDIVGAMTDKQTAIAALRPAGE